MEQPADKSAERAFTVRQWLEGGELRRVVFGVAIALLVPEQDLEDVLQAVMMGLWRRGLETFVNVSYVRQVAHSRALDLRRTGRRSGHGEPVASWDTATADPELHLLLCAGASALAAPMRQLLDLLFEEGLSEREAAARLQVSRGAIRRWKDRLLIRLGARKRSAVSGQQTADSRQQTADSRQQTADSRQQTADSRQIRALIDRVSRIFARPFEVPLSFPASSALPSL